MKVKIISSRISKTLTHEKEVNAFLDSLSQTINPEQIQTYINSDHDNTYGAMIITVIKYREELS